MLNHLIKIQSSFKDDLLRKVETFQTETSQFYHSYETVRNSQSHYTGESTCLHLSLTISS